MSLNPEGLTSERRVVTVLFADIVGFTAMADPLDPETVTDVMNEIFAMLGAEVEAVGGHVDKVVGDQLMALFGAPVAHEDDASRAVRAALSMQQAIQARGEALRQTLGQAPRLRIGVHSGLVVWGEMGPPGQARPTVMGDAVNVASRLQRAAPEGGVLVSDAIFRQVRGEVLSKTWDPLVVRGKSEPVAVYEIVGRRERAEPMHRPPFVNREEDLEQLKDLCARARRGRAQVAVVTGEPGVGKTRLVGEFVAGLSPEDGLLQASCPPYGGQSLGPLATLFRQFAGLTGQVTLAEVESRIPLGERAAHAAIVVSRLFGLIEMPETAAGSATGAGPEVSRETALLVAAEAIRAMLTRPTVVWIEDMQWADAGTREVLPFLVERLSNTPLLLIGNLRAGEEPFAWGGRTAVSTMQIEPLEPDHARSLLTSIAGAPLPATVERIVLEKASGNPFYLSEIFATLRSTGSLALDDRGAWRVSGAAEAVLPDTIQGALRARLDRLPSELRNIIQQAAVVGTAFRRSLLAELSGNPALDDLLARLEDAYLLARRDPLAADTEYVFVHPLLREVAYNTLLIKHQAALHRRVAESVERLYPDPSDEFAKTIGTHYAQAQMPEQAVPHLLRAGEHALRRYATREAMDLLEQVRPLAVEAGLMESAVSACEILGDLYLRVHDRGPKAWCEAWEFVRRHTNPAADPVRRARAAIRAAHARINDNELPDARRDLEEAAGLIPDGHPLWSDFHRVRAAMLIIASEFREALADASRAVEIADRQGTLEDRSRAYAVLAHPAILPLLGGHGRAIMRRWIVEAEETGDQRLVIEASQFFISDVWTRGIVDPDLLAHIEEVVRRAEEYGWTRDEAALRMMLGWANFLIGRWDLAEEALQRVFEFLVPRQAEITRLQGMYHILFPYFRGNLAMGQGRLEDARRIFEEAVAFAPFHSQIWLNHDLARCALLNGEVEYAREVMRTALAARDRWRCIICGCQANGIAAEFYATLDEGDLAATLAREAETTATEIGHVTTLIRVDRARARLATLAGHSAEAVSSSRRAIARGEALPIAQPFEHAQSLRVLGDAYLAADDGAAAAAAWRQAEERFRGVGADWHAVRLQEESLSRLS